MTFSRYSKLAAILTGQLICVIAVAGQDGINPQAGAMAHFSERR
jgi:hypothetical protein